MQAETCAFRSPTISRGMRQLAWMNLYTVSTGSPFSYRRTHGMRSPSWKTSVLSQAIVPGTLPPMSPWCATVTAKPITSSSKNTGFTMKMSGLWLAPSNGSLTM